MKRIYLIISLFTTALFLSGTASAQFDRVVKSVKNNAQRSVEQRATKRANSAVDQSLNKAEQGIEKEIRGNTGNNSNNRNSGNSNNSNTNSNSSNKNTSTSGTTGNSGSSKNTSTRSGNSGSVKTTTASSTGTTAGNEALKAWSYYNFLPGKTIMLEEDLEAEESGEFPSRWDLVSGTAEVAADGIKKRIIFKGKNSQIKPLMDKADYLPEAFTIEFDAWFPRSTAEVYTLKIQGIEDIRITLDKVEMGMFNGTTVDEPTRGSWRHVAMEYNNGKMKFYLESDRVLNVPKVVGEPASFSIAALSAAAGEGDPASVRNVRFTTGAADFDEELEDAGYFSTTGIRFEIGKTNMLPSSMGVINKIASMMKKEDMLRFNINVHTDTRGNEDFNETLAEKRGEAIKRELIAKGIRRERLRVKGYGSSNPVDESGTPESHATNARVVFMEF